MTHLLASGLFGMVFKHLWDCFHLDDSTSGLPKLFQLCFHTAQSHIPPQIAHVLGTAHLLTMTKPSSGVCPIVVGEALYWLTSLVLCLQFHEAFATHFSSHQFGVTTEGGYEVVIHGIRCILDLHRTGLLFSSHGKWFQFNVKKGDISKKLCSRWGHHIIHPLCSCIICIWVSSIL
jgi:hypothetical protein